MKKLIIALLCLGVGSISSAADNTSQQIQLLNSQIQAQLQKMQADQQKQIQTLNTQLQGQIKQLQTALEAEIQKGDTQSQAQIKQVQDNLEQQIKQVQQSIPAKP